MTNHHLSSHVVDLFVQLHKEKAKASRGRTELDEKFGQ